jgi:NADPH:quinone reductase-like Zn-dependent oxidoreductase
VTHDRNIVHREVPQNANFVMRWRGTDPNSVIVDELAKDSVGCHLREKAAMDFTGGRGVDQVIEVGGAGTLTRSFGAIRIGGKISLIGGLSGPATELNPGLILARRANVQGISVGSTQMFEAMNYAITANMIKPVIDKVFGFDEVQAAYKHMASGAHFGKIVVRVA